MATAAPRLLTVDEFLAIQWDSSDTKAELDNGVIRIIRMMAGGTADHSRVQGNIFGALFTRLRGGECRAHGSDMAVLVGEFSVRYPDVSVFCGRNRPEDGKLKAFDDPKLIVEVLSPGTRDQDIETKLPEYRNIASLQTILYVDPDAAMIRQFTRKGDLSWHEVSLQEGSEVVISSLGVTLPWSEVFAP